MSIQLSDVLCQQHIRLVYGQLVKPPFIFSTALHPLCFDLLGWYYWLGSMATRSLSHEARPGQDKEIRRYGNIENSRITI